MKIYHSSIKNFDSTAKFKKVKKKIRVQFFGTHSEYFCYI